MNKSKTVKVQNIKIGSGERLVLIAGPCVIESEKSCLRHAEMLKTITDKVRIPLIFKSSFDKANRSSIDSYRGPGLKKGLKILKKVKDQLNLPVTSDVHLPEQVKEAAEVLDVLQIPAFLCRQTDLVTTCAKTKKPINIKKGQFLSPYEMQNIIKKAETRGNRNIILTERGVVFGYNNLVSDFRSILIMKETGYPVCYDASHSVQKPGGLGKKSGGDGRFIPNLAKAAVAVGVDALFLEPHQNPKKALSDGPNMIELNTLPSLLEELIAISQIR